MEGIEYIYELCEALPRSGPGDNKYTRRAFNSIPQPPEHPLILDIGCGQGMQTIELARISKGTVIAVDNHQTFLDLLVKQVKKQKIERKIITKQSWISGPDQALSRSASLKTSIVILRCMPLMQVRAL